MHPQTIAKLLTTILRRVLEGLGLGKVGMGNHFLSVSSDPAYECPIQI